MEPGYEALTRRFGADRAFRIVKEGQNSLAWVASFVAEEGIDCDFRIVGRFHAAHAPPLRGAGAPECDAARGLEVAAHMVARANCFTSRLGAASPQAYCSSGTLRVDPGRFHQGMLDRAMTAGAVVIPHCAATAIHREGGGFRVEQRQHHRRTQRCRGDERLHRKADAVAALNGSSRSAATLLRPSRSPATR